MAAEADTGKMGAGGETLAVHLPPLSEEDPLHQDKKRILERRNLACLFHFPISSSAVETLKLLDQMIQAARVVHMDKLELYFAGDDDIGPFSARNETESLNLLFKTMNKLLLTSNAVVKEVLQMLKDEIVVRLRSVGKTDGEKMISETQNPDAEDSLLKWGEHHGVKSKLQIAYLDTSVDEEDGTAQSMKENDRVVLETLLSIFNPMLEELPEPEESERESANWDVKLALDYKDLQRRIISSIVISCTSALENV
nr:unnamed protein product [Digitaria exilis]